MDQNSLAKKCKNLVIPCEENNFQPTFLSSNLFYFALTFIVLAKIISLVLFEGYFGASIFNEISKQDIYSLVNEERNKQGFSTLNINSNLELAAQMKVADIQSHGYFSHISPAGVTPWYWIARSGYSYHIAGENLAMSFISSSEAFSAWMNSDGHRNNILNSQFSDTGVASGEAVINGEKTVVIVQMFGKPKQQNIITKQIIPSVEAQNIPVPPRPLPNKIPERKDPITLLVINTEETGPSEVSIQSLEETAYSLNYVIKDLMKWVFIISVIVLVLKIFVAIKKQFPRLIIKAIILILVIYGLWFTDLINTGFRGSVIIGEGLVLENK